MPASPSRGVPRFREADKQIETMTMHGPSLGVELEQALTVVRAAGYRVSKSRGPKSKIEAPLSLNAVGKPFSPQYDPNYRLRHKPSYGHLRLPYPTTMRFVGDPPNYDPNRHVYRTEPEAPSSDQRSAEPAVQKREPLILTFILRQRIASHEAAHAVAARAYGLSVDYAEIGTAETDAGLGRVRYIRGEAEETDEVAWARTVVSLAGLTADTVLYNARDRFEGGTTDFTLAQQYALQVDLDNSDEVIAQARTAALRVVSDNRTVIDYLAAVLEHHDRLSGAEIDGIIGSVCFAGKVKPGPARPSLSPEAAP